MQLFTSVYSGCKSQPTAFALVTFTHWTTQAVVLDGVPALVDACEFVTVDETDPAAVLDDVPTFVAACELVAVAGVD